MMTIQNAVQKAVHNIGGPTSAGNLLETSSTAIHQWIRKGYVPKYRLAVKLASLSGMSIESLRARGELK